MNVHEFRTKYRQELQPRVYHGYAHLMVTLGLGLAVILLAATQLTSLEWSAYWAIPAALLFANFVEYTGHRFLLHGEVAKSTVFYREHTFLHHFYFTHEAIVIESHRDLHRVLFPWFGILFFVGLVGTPLAYLVGLMWGKNVGLVFLMTEVSYFLAYEVCHTICHFEDSHPIFRLPGLSRMKEHHRQHHNVRLMGEKNFNIVLPFFYPLFDKLFGTYQTGERG